MKVSEKDKFLWLGNWPALDFVNTEIVHDAKTIELLASEEDFAHWLVQSKLIKAAQTPSEVLAKALRLARSFRQELRSGLQELIRNGRIPRSLMDSVNRLLQRHAIRFDLQEKGRQFRLNTDWVLREPEDLCAPIALSFAQLLTTADIRRIRRCKNPECVLYFYDTSKSGTRSWCSLDICGNKLRAAAYRQRQSHGST